MGLGRGSESRGRGPTITAAKRRTGRDRGRLAWGLGPGVGEVISSLLALPPSGLVQKGPPLLVFLRAWLFSMSPHLVSLCPSFYLSVQTVVGISRDPKHAQHGTALLTKRRLTSIPLANSAKTHGKVNTFLGSSWTWKLEASEILLDSHVKIPSNHPTWAAADYKAAKTKKPPKEQKTSSRKPFRTEGGK